MRPKARPKALFADNLHRVRDMDVLFEVERTDAVGSLCTRPKIALFSKRTLREQLDTKDLRNSGYERWKKGIVSRFNSGSRQRHSRSDYHRMLELSKQWLYFDG